MPDIFVAKDAKKLPERVPKSKKRAHKKGSKKSKKHTGALKYPKTHAERNRLPGHTHNALAAFCYFPDYVKFVNQDPEEKVILVLRKHPITNLGWILIAFVLILAPSFLPLINLFEVLPTSFQIVLVLVWYLLTTAYVFEKFLSWYFHVNIVTDERIIEVDFIHLIHREITDANIDQIQDATVQMTGASRTFFNFGDVIIQTAAAVPRIGFEAVPSPDRVAKILRELRIEEEVEKLEGRVR